MVINFFNETTTGFSEEFDVVLFAASIRKFSVTLANLLNQFGPASEGGRGLIGPKKSANGGEDRKR
jgi:hypothetical protein